MPRNDQVTRQWHLLQRLGAARQGLTLAQLVEAIPAACVSRPRKRGKSGLNEAERHFM
jgi:hypothetical protein